MTVLARRAKRLPLQWAAASRATPWRADWLAGWLNQWNCSWLPAAK